MGDYCWREHWEDKTEGGQEITWVVRLPNDWLAYEKLTKAGKSLSICFPDGKRFDCSDYGLIPKRKLRHWTAKEAVGYLDKCLRNGSDEAEYIDSVKATGLTVFHHRPSENKFVTFQQLIDRGYTCNDGSPCGVYE